MHRLSDAPDPPQPKPAAKAAAKGKAAAKAKAAAEPVEKLTPEEEKRRRNDEVLKADVGNMKDIFSGVVDEKDSETEKKLATFVPITEGDFEEFAKMLDERIAPSKVPLLPALTHSALPCNRARLIRVSL